MKTIWKCKNPECEKIFPVLARISYERHEPKGMATERIIVEKPCCPYCESIEFEVRELNSIRPTLPTKEDLEKMKDEKFQLLTKMKLPQLWKIAAELEIPKSKDYHVKKKAEIIQQILDRQAGVEARRLREPPQLV